MEYADIRRILCTGLIGLSLVSGPLTVPVYGSDIVTSGGGAGEYESSSSVRGLERAIQNDNEWMAEADRLMDELRALDVRLYTLINTAGGEDSRQKLVRERNNVRRLTVDLLEARNTVYTRLQKNHMEYTRLELAPDMNFQVGF